MLSFCLECGRQLLLNGIDRNITGDEKVSQNNVIATIHSDESEMNCLYYNTELSVKAEF